MSNKALAIHPQFVFKGKRPTAVLLDIKQYEEILERLEDIQDLKELKQLPSKNLKFTPLEDFRKELGV